MVVVTKERVTYVAKHVYKIHRGIGLKSILEQLDDFMESSARNNWLCDKHLRVYVRKGIRYIEGQMLNTVDVANIESPPKYKGKGFFKQFMLKVESLGRPIFVENIHNPNLFDMLKKHGYQEVQSATICKHLYKL